MKKLLLLKKIFNEVNHLINTERFKSNNRLNESSFTRKRKMSFKDIIYFILASPQKSLSFELTQYFQQLGVTSQKTISKQAFSNTRQKILPSAFKMLFNTTTNVSKMCSHYKLWHNHQLLAVDGTTIQLPDTIENRSYFGSQSNNSTPMAMAKATALYDVLNDIIVNVTLCHYKTSEKDQALDLMNTKALETKQFAPIILFDRGYPSRELISEVESKHCLYLMRCSKKFITVVNNSPEGDYIVSDQYKDCSTKLRVIKFKLDEDTTETLITNIFNTDYTINDFKELYFKRWGIETKYGEIKNRLNIENFSGKKPIAIEQDFYATLFISNIVAAFKEEVDCLITEDSERKKSNKKYQANRNYLIGIIVSNILELLTKKYKQNKLIQDIFNKSLRNRSQIRPNRSRERKIIHNKANFSMTLKTNI